MYSFGQIPFSIPQVATYSPKVVSPVGAPVSFPSTSASLPNDLLLSQRCKEFTYEALSNATNGFSKQNVLGTGSFGAVYRGTMDDQTEVAVKVLTNPSQAGFEDEVKVLSKFRHPNLVMLLGIGRNGKERLLVYECMENGDCEKRLKDPERAVKFQWKQRLSVLMDACRGIAYMINSCPMAFHRDIKPSNMLLDRHGVAKMADFGLACELPSPDLTSMRLQNSAGTIGYACPTYIKSGVVSESSEVYSFGICILEFLTNQPPAVVNPKIPSQVVYLVETLQGRVKSLTSLLDKKAGWPVHVASQLAELVFECCHPQPEKRPKFVALAKAIKRIQAEAENPHANDSPVVPQTNPVKPTNAGSRFSPVKSHKITDLPVLSARPAPPIQATSLGALPYPFVMSPMREVDTCYVMSVRIVGSAVPPKQFEFALNKTLKLLQMVGRNFANGMITSALGDDPRWLSLIDPSHFALILDDDGLCVRPLTERGVIVGTQFIAKGTDAIVKKDQNVDLQFPGVAQLVLNVKEIRPTRENLSSSYSGMKSAR